MCMHLGEVGLLEDRVGEIGGDEVGACSVKGTAGRARREGWGVQGGV